MLDMKQETVRQFIQNPANVSSSPLDVAKLMYYIVFERTISLFVRGFLAELENGVRPPLANIIYSNLKDLPHAIIQLRELCRKTPESAALAVFDVGEKNVRRASPWNPPYY